MTGTVSLPALPNILALDPGGTTGYCLHHSNQLVLDQGHIGPHEHHLDLWKFLAEVFKASVGTTDKPEELHIVCEQFEFRQTERHRDFINYIPREYIGVVKLFYQRYRPSSSILPRQLQLHFQSASQAIGDGAFFGDDEKIKKLGLWVPGMKHAMDATRHYLYYRVFTLGDKSLLQKLR